MLYSYLKWYLPPGAGSVFCSLRQLGRSSKFLSLLELPYLQVEIIYTPKWHMLGHLHCIPSKERKKRRIKSRQPRCFRKQNKTKQFSFVSTPDVCGAFPTTSNSAALAGVLQFNLILTLCIFLNVLSGPTV